MQNAIKCKHASKVKLHQSLCIRRCAQPVLLLRWKKKINKYCAWPFKSTVLLATTSWWHAANQSDRLFWSRLPVVYLDTWRGEDANAQRACDRFQRPAQLIGSCCKMESMRPPNCRGRCDDECCTVKATRFTNLIVTHACQWNALNSE